MPPALGLAQTVRLAVRLGRLHQAREAPGGVQVEVLLRDERLQAKEVLHVLHDLRRVVDQLLAADEVELAPGEVLEPAVQVLGVHPDADSAPGSVDDTQAVVQERHVLERLHLAVSLGGRLHVVGDGPGDGVPDHHQQLDVAGHGLHALGHLPSDEVAGGLLHRQLALLAHRHQGSVTRNARQRQTRASVRATLVNGMGEKRGKKEKEVIPILML